MSPNFASHLQYHTWLVTLTWPLTLWPWPWPTCDIWLTLWPWPALDMTLRSLTWPCDLELSFWPWPDFVTLICLVLFHPCYHLLTLSSPTSPVSVSHPVITCQLSSDVCLSVIPLHPNYYLLTPTVVPIAGFQCPLEVINTASCYLPVITYLWCLSVIPLSSAAS